MAETNSSSLRIHHYSLTYSKLIIFNEVNQLLPINYYQKKTITYQFDVNLEGFLRIVMPESTWLSQ